MRRYASQFAKGASRGRGGDKISTRYSKLSLCARLAVALHCLEGLCAAHLVASREVREYADYLWDLPLVRSPEEFERWFSRGAALAISPGGPLPEAVLAELRAAGVDAGLFQRLLRHTAEVVGGSFYGATDGEGSLRSLEAVIAVAAEAGVAAPPASRFAGSLLRDGDGFGLGITRAERDRWRTR